VLGAWCLVQVLVLVLGLVLGCLVLEQKSICYGRLDSFWLAIVFNAQWKFLLMRLARNTVGFLKIPPFF
jgi:hypothetical protein